MVLPALRGGASGRWRAHRNCPASYPHHRPKLRHRDRYMTPPIQPIRPRERDTILQALAAGVVPRTGLRHIQVGRASEVSALVRDIDRIADGGAAIRFVIGEYGAGKTFFLNLV